MRADCHYTAADMLEAIAADRDQWKVDCEEFRREQDYQIKRVQDLADKLIAAEAKLADVTEWLRRNTIDRTGNEKWGDQRANIYVGEILERLSALDMSNPKEPKR